MTLTLIGPATGRVTNAPTATADTALGHALLAALRRIVVSGCDLDPDILHSTLPAGRAVLELTTAARTFVAGRPGDGGTPLTNGPGIVVMRELARTLDLLERVVRPEIPTTDPATVLPHGLADAYRTFLEIVARPA